MDGVLVAVDGSESMRVMDVPRLASVLSAPPTVPRGVTPAPASESGLSTLIPYQNKPALIGYYIGVFALLPAVGYLLAIPAIVLGIVGLTRRIKSPQSKGMAHAIAAIVLGVGGPLFWTLIMIFAMNA